MGTVAPAKLRIGDDARDVPHAVTGGACHFTIGRGRILQHVLEDGFVAALPSWIGFVGHWYLKIITQAL